MYSLLRILPVGTSCWVSFLIGQLKIIFWKLVSHCHKRFDNNNNRPRRQIFCVSIECRSFVSLSHRINIGGRLKLIMVITFTTDQVFLSARIVFRVVGVKAIISSILEYIDKLPQSSFHWLSEELKMKV